MQEEFWLDQQLHISWMRYQPAWTITPQFRLSNSGGRWFISWMSQWSYLYCNLRLRHDLFDDIILQGPRENVLVFFEHIMGFKCRSKERGCTLIFRKWFPRRTNSNTGSERTKSLPRRLALSQLANSFWKILVSLVTKLKPILQACFSKELLLMQRNSFIYVFRSQNHPDSDNGHYILHCIFQKQKWNVQVVWFTKIYTENRISYEVENS